MAIRASVNLGTAALAINNTGANDYVGIIQATWIPDEAEGNLVSGDYQYNSGNNRRSTSSVTISRTNM
jgi:hypothetical protein